MTEKKEDRKKTEKEEEEKKKRKKKTATIGLHSHLATHSNIYLPAFNFCFTILNSNLSSLLFRLQISACFSFYR